jgi:hypothetical protein
VNFQKRATPLLVVCTSNTATKEGEKKLPRGILMALEQDDSESVVSAFRNETFMSAQLALFCSRGRAFFGTLID